MCQLFDLGCMGCVFFWGMYWVVFFHMCSMYYFVFLLFQFAIVYSRIIGWWSWVIRFSCWNESECKCWVKMFINCNYLNETKCCYLSAIIEWSWMQLYNECNWIFLVYCLMCNVLLKLIVVGLRLDACILLKLNVNA